MRIGDETIGQKIAEARTRRGLTQARLAGVVGLDRSVIAKIETGHRRVSAVELADLATRIEWFVH